MSDNPYDKAWEVSVYFWSSGDEKRTISVLVGGAVCGIAEVAPAASAVSWEGGSASFDWWHDCAEPPSLPQASHAWVTVERCCWCDWWKYCNGGTVSYAVAPFTGVGERTATVTISGGVHTITQSGQADCNGNGLGDLWEIQQGIASDLNGNGIPDSCDCPADYDGSGIVDGADIGLLLLQWNTASSAFDLTGDGVVDGADLGILLLQWGLCP